MSITKEQTVTLLNNFLKSYKPITFTAYAASIKHFSSFIYSCPPIDGVYRFFNLEPTAAIKVMDKYKQGMLNAKLSFSVVNRHLSVIRSMVRYSFRAKLICWVADIDLCRVSSKRAQSSIDCAAAVNKASRYHNTTKAVRDAAIIQMIASLSLRASEVVALRMTDIQGDKLYIRKFGHMDGVWNTIPTKAYNTLQQWIQERGNHPGFLFFRLDIKNAKSAVNPLTVRGVHKLFRLYGVSTPQAMRSVTIRKALASGASIDDVVGYTRLSLASLDAYVKNPSLAQAIEDTL